MQWPSRLGAHSLGPTSFNSFGTGAQELRCMGFVAPPNVASSQARDQTRVLCIGRGVPSPWTTREVQSQKSQWAKSGSLEGQVDFEMIKLYHAQGRLGLRRVEHGSCGERSRKGHEYNLEERPSLAPGHHQLNALGASCGCKASTAGTLPPACLSSEDFSATHTGEQALMARSHFTEGSFSASHRSYRAHGA